MRAHRTGSNLYVCAVTIVMATALVVPAVLHAQEADLGERLQGAVQKLDQGDTVGAMMELEGILSRDDEYWPAYFYLGRAQAQLGDDLGAKQSFMRAAELDPGNAELHYLVATAAWALADFEAAWNQVVAARQAGYPQAPVDQMLKGLEQYSDRPADLEARLDATRFVVLAGEAGADADLLLRTRNSIFGARMLGLVLDPAIADYRVEMTGAKGAWTCRVLNGEGDVVLEKAAGEAAPTGSIPGLEMEGLVRDLALLPKG
jgi:tetratricopeptide (TPR) repeat protein